MADDDTECDHTLCICCVHIFEHQRPVLLAYRDDKDAGDQNPCAVYMCGEDDHYSYKDGRAVGFGHLADWDETLLHPSSIKLGQTFSRQAVGASWDEEETL